MPGIDEGARPMLMVVSPGLLVGFQLDLIYDLNHPLSNSVSVSPQPLQEAIARLESPGV